MAGHLTVCVRHDGINIIIVVSGANNSSRHASPLQSLQLHMNDTSLVLNIDVKNIGLQIKKT